MKTRKIFRHKIVTACAAAVFALAIYPEQTYAQTGSEALPHVRVTHDPRAAAMGGAGVVSASLAWASFSNAAAIPYSGQTMDVAASYHNWQPDAAATSFISAAGAWNIKGKVGLALGFSWGANPEYESFNGYGESEGMFSPSDMQVNFGVGWRFLPYLSAGANVKYVRSSLAEGHAYGAGASDLFLMSEVSDFRVALGVSSLGSKVTSASGDKFGLPASVTLGAGYGHTFAQKHGVEILAEADWYFSGALSANAGAEYTFNDLVSVRAGYRYGGKSVIPSYASVGAGVKFFGVHLDAAFLIASGPLKNTFCIGAGYSF